MANFKVMYPVVYASYYNMYRDKGMLLICMTSRFRFPVKISKECTKIYSLIDSLSRRVLEFCLG